MWSQALREGTEALRSLSLLWDVAQLETLKETLNTSGLSDPRADNPIHGLSGSPKRVNC